MPKYIELEKALHVLDNVMSDEGIKHKGKAIRKRLNELPGEDVVEVRCKDCLYSRKDSDYEHGYMCYKHIYHPCIGETRHRKLVQDIDFCSFGVRKEGAKE